MSSRIIVAIVAVFAVVLSLAAPVAVDAQEARLAPVEREAYENLNQAVANLARAVNMASDFNGTRPRGWIAERYDAVAEWFEDVANAINRAHRAHRTAEAARDEPDRIIHGRGTLEHGSYTEREVSSALKQYAMMMLGTQAGAEAEAAAWDNLRILAGFPGTRRVRTGGILWEELLECVGYEPSSCRELARATKVMADEHRRATDVHIRLNREAMGAINGAVWEVIEIARGFGVDASDVVSASAEGNRMMDGEWPGEDAFDSALRTLVDGGAALARRAIFRLRARASDVRSRGEPLEQERAANRPGPTEQERTEQEQGSRNAEAERTGQGPRNAETADAGRPADVVTTSEAECCSSTEEWLEAIAVAMAEARSAANAVRAAEYWEDAHPHHVRGERATSRVRGLLSGRVGRLVVPNAQGRFFASAIRGRSARDEWMEVNAMLSECPGKPRRPR